MHFWNLNFHIRLTFQAAADGVITKLVDAFSAITPDGRPPAHLAAEMAKHSVDLFDHMRNNGCVYVCGGATVGLY